MSACLPGRPTTSRLPDSLLLGKRQWTNNGLFLCTLSYREHLILGPVDVPHIVRDVWEFAGDLRAIYDELRIAAGIVPDHEMQPATAGTRAATGRSAGPSRSAYPESA
jgi:hypothetical protein